jgi:hypothetical protein
MIDKFDAPRFSWRTIELTESGFIDIWALDTNNIFLLNYSEKSLYKISGGNVDHFNAGNYEMFSMAGISENEIYIFGESYAYELTFIKWNGAGFEYFPTGVFLSEYSNPWFRGCIGNSNEAWLCSQKGIAKLEGGNITTYLYPDSNMTVLDIFETPDNKIQIICERSLPGEYLQSLFELQDTTFTKIFDFTQPISSYFDYTYLKELNGYKYGLTFNQNNNYGLICFKNFSGAGFSDNFCINKGISLSIPVGSNFQDLTFIAYTEESVFEHSRKGILNWNGIVLSREIELPAPGFFGDNDKIFSANANTIIVLCQGRFPVKIFVGTRK